MYTNNNDGQHPGAVLITGASDRIGLELAKECIELGYRAVIHYRTSPEPAKTVFGGDERIFFIRAELTDSPQKFMAEVRKLPVKLEGLINNASIFRPGDLSDPDRFHYILSINTLIPLKLSTEFVKCVNGGGWIINITDSRVRQMNKRYQNYRVSKLLLDEITRQLAFLYAPKIRVNAIAPGIILPQKHALPEDKDTMPNRYDLSDDQNDLTASIPAGRIGDPRNLRQALRFLIKNDYITGAVIPVDGGRHL